ncbi:MAG TPA: hypothetical protein VKB51_06390 [bacterium]|nr:hypothetical protein [bacterium]
MQVHDKTLTFDRSLWVQHGGVDVAEQEGRIVVTGRDEDSYLKVFNHFGRVLKLYTFEAGRWVDADTGGPAQALDESQAGHLPGGEPVTVLPASATAPKRGTDKTGTVKPSARKAGAGKAAAGKAPTRKTAAAKPVGRKPAARKSTAKPREGRSSGKGRSGGRSA